MYITLADEKMKNVSLDKDKISGDGIVLYCDGSTKPKNPGHNGYGIHGFAFNNNTPKKGTGNPLQVLTHTGYVDSKQYKAMENADPVVEPTCYVDVIGSTDIFGSNNTAELLAARTAIQIIARSNVKTGLIKTDSQYVERGIKIWSASWISNNWHKRDGTPVPNADIWKDVLAEIAEANRNGQTIEVMWVKGHTDSIKDVFGIYGNIMADKLANIGSEKAKVGIDEILINVTDVEGYWKNTSKRNPMISHRTLYITGESHNLKNVYFVGNHGKDDDFIGRADPDGSLGVVCVAEADPVLDLLKEYVHKESSDVNRLAFIRTDALFANNRSEDVIKYGISAFIQKNANRIDLNSADKEPILRDINPPRLALRTFDHLNTLFTRLQMFQDGRLNVRGNFAITDITDHFYDTSKKKVKGEAVITRSLKNSFKVGTPSTKVNVKYIAKKTDLENGTFITEEREKEIVLSLNIDLPDRNCLKRIDSTTPEVFCITEMESDKCFRYYIVIKNAKNEIGIWAGFYSNQVYLF